MKLNLSQCLCAVVAAAIIAATGSIAIAADAVRTASAYKAEDRTVDVFEAMEKGEIDVKLVLKGPEGGNLLVKNKTDKPLNIRVPEAFAGMPVLAQIGGGLGGGGLGGGIGGGAQGVGGGLGGGFGGGGGLGGGGGGGLGGGVFNVAPDKVSKVKVNSVCLEHGKDDPTSRMEYTIKPITELTNKPEVIELCKMLYRGEIDQTSAQMAAWHLQNGLSWEELARKEKVHLSNGYIEMYFNRNNLAVAMKSVAVAGERAKHQPQSPSTQSPGEQGAE